MSNSTFMLEHQHEQLITQVDYNTSLVVKIAIHEMLSEQYIEGVRLGKYASDEDAELDVLRLSEGMSYKTRLAGVPFGGAKAVILVDGREADLAVRAARFRAFGRFVNDLKGIYVTAEG